MRTRSKLLLAGLTSALALWAAVGTADARRFEISSEAIRAVWSTVRLEDLAGMRSACPVTLEGSFHSRTFSKVCGELVGYITRAITRKEGCGVENESLWLSNGDNAAVNTLPWHLRYDSFTGTLPFASTVKLQVIGLGVKFFGTTCEFRSEMIRPTYLIFNLNTETSIRRGRIESVRWDETARIRRINGLCGAEGILAGTGSVTILGEAAPVAIELVT